MDASISVAHHVWFNMLLSIVNKAARIRVTSLKRKRLSRPFQICRPPKHMSGFLGGQCPIISYDMDISVQEGVSVDDSTR